MLTALAAGALALALPSVAGGDSDLGEVDGIAYVSDEATGTGVVKLTLDCPPGTWPGGGGADPAWFKRIEPADGPDADSTPDDLMKVWVDRRTFTSTVTGYAICIDEKPKYTVRSKDLRRNRAKTAKAPCPDGTSVIGGGGNSSGEHIVGSYPFDDGDPNSRPDDGWAFRTWAGAERGKVRALAVCLDVRPEYRTGTGTLPVNGSSVPTETCPATHHLVGIGARSKAPPAETSIGELSPLDASAGEGSDPDSVPDDRGRMAINNSSASIPAPWESMIACIE